MIPNLEQRASAPIGALPERVSVKIASILLVEDALPIRKKFIEILFRSGFHADKVSIATTSEVALEAFAREFPTLVFAELIGSDAEAGLLMVEEMLAINPLVKIVLVTAEDPGGHLVRRAVKVGVFAVVSKPLRHEKIRQVLSEIENEDGGIERFR